MSMQNENNKEALGEVLSLVRRIAVELTFLAPENDKNFNQILNSLRKSLSRITDEAALKDSADVFFQYLIDGDAVTADKGVADIATAIQELFSVLDVEFPLDGGSTDSKLTQGSVPSLDSVAAAVRQLIPIATQMHRAAQAQTANQEPGQESPLVNAAAPQSASSGDLLSAAQVVGPALKRIIERIQILDMESDRARKLKAQFDAAESFPDLQFVLEVAVQVVIDIASDIDLERGNTEHFLSEVRLKLSMLEEGLVGIIDVDSSMANTEHFHAEMSGEVSGIESAVSESVSLEALKEVVAERIEVLAGRLTDYVDKERSQLKIAQEKVDNLSSQMQAMGSEIEGLQIQIHEKQVANVTDALTGVANRGGFDRQIADEIARCQRIKYPLSVMFIDIDKFKEVNDSYGHNAGDTVLKAVAAVIRKRVRETDYVARYGGDEFVLLLPNTGINDAGRVGNELLEMMGKTGFRGGGKSVNVTLSIGVAQYKGDETAESVLERADRALYRVKQAGRNGIALEE
ncbi:MAG: GGDEF domain-containing protein [Porticoccaceae bacterium]|nr:GGDEF domain-containing protein [Porticoccaceae bacterium]